MGNSDREYRLKKAKEALQAEIASKEAEVKKLNDSLSFNRAYLEHIDDLFDPRKIEVNNLWHRTFCFLVNEKNEIVEVRCATVTSPYSSEGKHVSIIDGQEALWKFIDDNFYPFVYKLEEVLSQISLKDGKKLVELMKKKYEEETKVIVSSLNDLPKEPFSKKNERKLTLGVHPFYQHLDIYINPNGEICGVGVLDREDERYCIKTIGEYEKVNYNPLTISMATDYNGAWNLIKDNILSYIDYLPTILNYLNAEETRRFIDIINQVRENKKPMSLSK